MASIRRRHGNWQAQVRRSGSRALSKTFPTKREAEAWARQAETDADSKLSGSSSEKTILHTPPLGELLERYRTEVTPRKRGASVEEYRIRKLQRHPISNKPADKIGPSDVANYRDERLRSVSGETVRQDLVLISQVFEVARREWQISVPNNPVAEVRKPPAAKPRTRRVSEEEARRLLDLASRTRNPLVTEVIKFALATGMRRGEILRVRWVHIDWGSCTLEIPESKNGHARVIPLSYAALELLKRVRSAEPDRELVFPISANAFKLAWQRLREKSGITNIRFHDFRHEAVSRFFEAGLSLPEVALISGHRDARQLMRYTHLKAARIAKKLHDAERRGAE